MPSRVMKVAASVDLDFSQRAYLSEWMDEPCTYEEFGACLHDLAQVNRMTFAYRPTRLWLQRLVACLPPGAAPLHIVDVGCGQGDMLRYIARWAARRKLAVRLTGIDLNPYAARAAAACTPAYMQIEWLTSDAFAYAPGDPHASLAQDREQGFDQVDEEVPGQGIDIVISSLFTHHLSDAEIVRFLGWMERVTRCGWFINDLHRSALPYHVFRMLARAAQWHPFVQHDGPISIRRSFRAADWRHYCVQAGLAPGVVNIEEFRPARLCVGRIK